MEYAVGENVVHPAHGAGTIVDIQEHEIIEGLTRYYVIEFDVNNLTVSVPVRRTKQIGLRAVMTEEKFTQVINTLSKRPKQLPKDYKERRALLAGLIQSGLPLKVAEALRELVWRREDKHLTVADSRMLDQARTMLVHEMALATDTDLPVIEAAIDDALTEAVAKCMAAAAAEKTH
ncbi:MAG: CarD family transcriptional regulator [Caldilineaceae bacterium]